MSLIRDKILTGIMLLLVGILFWVAPATTTRAIYGAVGVVLALSGAIRLIIALRIRGTSFLKILTIAIAILILILGIFLIINPEFLINYSFIVFGLIMIVNGLVNIFSVLKGEINVGGNKPIYLILSVLLVIAGVIVLINPFSTAQTLTMGIGFMLILSGIINIIIALRIKIRY